MDIPFIAFFLKNLEKPISLSMKANLAKLERIKWLDSFQNLLASLEEDAQSGLVLLIQNIGLSEAEIQIKLLTIFRSGKSKARLDALTALMQFSGEQIDRLVWDASGDTDPEVQVEALSSLGERNISNSNSRILQFADSPDEHVRETVQKLMPNFKFSRFFEMFDRLSEEQRRTMFNLVKILDSQTVDSLTKILTIGEPMEQAKALVCIDYGGMVPVLEDSLCNILSKGEIPVIRVKAAELLAAGQRELSRSTLVQALHRDPVPEVRAAAKASLEKRPTYWNTAKEE
jgi:hypothetical protein